MNRIEKFLKKLTEKEQEVFFLLMFQLKKDYKKVPHLQKITGKKGLFRIRVGKYRLIFKIRNKKVDIIRITKRSNRTYKNL